MLFLKIVYIWTKLWSSELCIIAGSLPLKIFTNNTLNI